MRSPVFFLHLCGLLVLSGCLSFEARLEERAQAIGASGAATWKYSGAVATPDRIEDIDHGHLDLSLLNAGWRFGVGGLTREDLQALANTLRLVLSGEAGDGDVSIRVDGTGLPPGNWERLPVGYDWIDLAEVDPALFDRIVGVYNRNLSKPGSARYYLGWAEIQRLRACKRINN